MIPVLSILVITHNQRELLRRCINSILEQSLKVPYEIIVSDDRSSDGTNLFIQECKLKIEGDKSKGKRQNLLDFIYVQCNSDECNPKNVSERCGWNKLTAYNKACGKYFVNIDADDYLRNKSIYQDQIDLLESHPECSMCMQDIWQVNDGENDEKGFRWPSFGKLQNGQIIPANLVITKYRALNQGYMIRRHPEDNMEKLYGKYYDDTIITIHHLQYGPCIYIDRADYIWVQYNTSITKTLVGDDNLVEYGMLPLHHIRLIPTFKNVFMEDGLHIWVHMFKVLSEQKYKLNLTERTLAGFCEQNGYLYQIFCKKELSISDRLRLRKIRLILLIYSRFGLKKWSFLYKQLTNRQYD